MPDRTTLEAERRSEKGKGAARALRRNGYIPAVLYGHSEKTQPCKVKANELEKLLAAGSYESTLIDLQLDGGKQQQVLIREVQLHPYRSEVLHVDFLAVRKGEKVRLEVPVRLAGVAPGVKEGGIIEHLRHEVEVRCIPSRIPEALELDISTAGIGDSVTVADLVVPEDVEVTSDPATVIASIVPPSVHKVEEAVEIEEVEAAEEEVEPEVVGRGKAAEEAEPAPEEES